MLVSRFRSVFPDSPLVGLDRLMDTLLADQVSGMRGQPALNAWETPDSVIVEAELPGYRIEDLDISMVNNELTIKGMRPDSKPEGAAILRRERTAGEFTRRVRLGVAIDSGRVAAALTNGVLTVELPKAAAARPRRIEIAAR